MFETKDLLVSFDAINCGLGALIPSNSSQVGIYNGQSNLHCDQRYTMNNFECVQSWITANPIDVGDGTLRVLQGKVLNNHINNHILFILFIKCFHEMDALPHDVFSFQEVINCMKNSEKCSLIIQKIKIGMS